MRAWLIDKDEQGKPLLRLGEVETPEPGPGEIRVRVQAVGVNRADLLQVLGQYPAPPGVDPRIPGLEYTGVVDAVGPRVRLHQVGDRVMGLVPGAAYAEYVVVTEREAIPVPAGVDLVQAAALPEDYLTAYRALYIEGGLQPGQWALIRPATAGVGLAAVQLVRALGGRTIGTSRSSERLEQARARGLGVALLDNGSPLAPRVMAVTAGEGVSVVLDMLGGGALADNLGSLREEGSLVVIGLLTGREAPLNLGQLLMRRLRIKAMTMRAQPLEERIRIARVFVDRLTPLFATGRLTPLVSLVRDFDEAPQAHQDMAANKHFGKIVLKL